MTSLACEAQARDEHQRERQPQLRSLTVAQALRQCLTYHTETTRRAIVFARTPDSTFTIEQFSLQANGHCSFVMIAV